MFAVIALLFDIFKGLNFTVSLILMQFGAAILSCFYVPLELQTLVTLILLERKSKNIPYPLLG